MTDPSFKPTDCRRPATESMSEEAIMRLKPDNAFTRRRTIVEFNDKATGAKYSIDLPYTGEANEVTSQMAFKWTSQTAFELAWVTVDNHMASPLTTDDATGYSGGGNLYLTAYHFWMQRTHWYNPGKVADLIGASLEDGVTNSVNIDVGFLFEGRTTNLLDIAVKRFTEKVHKQPELLSQYIKDTWGVLDEYPDNYAAWLSDHQDEVAQELSDTSDGYFCEEIEKLARSLWDEFREFIIDPYTVPFTVRYPNQQYFDGHSEDWPREPQSVEAVWHPCETAREQLDYGAREQPLNTNDDYEVVSINANDDGTHTWTLTAKDGTTRSSDKAYPTEEEAAEAAVQSETWASKHTRAREYAEECMKLFFDWSEGHNYVVHTAKAEFDYNKVAIVKDEDYESVGVIGEAAMEKQLKEALG